MSVLTDEQLRTQAQQIKNETSRRANTAVRVGTMLENLVDSKLNGIQGLTPWDFSSSGENPGDYPTDTSKVYEVTDDSVMPAGTWLAWNGTAWRTK